jgi:3-hydroxyanthranilate 3,4-dioxygenase
LRYEYEGADNPRNPAILFKEHAMAQAQTASTTQADTGPSSFNLMKWIAENPDKLKPPIGAKTIFREDDFMVTVVGGPNARTDYHVNQTEEFFFQLKGAVNIRIQHNGKPHDITLPEGHIYLLSANVPHAPMRGPNTVGLIIERIRKPGMTDTHRWYCEKCNNVLFEKTAQIEVLERDMPPVFEAYYSNPDNQNCKKCGHVNPGRPQR